MKNSFMKYACDLAKKGKGHTGTNPCVGAVIVKNDEVVGMGWHMYQGGAHAEVNAIANAAENVFGSDLYVTLEPCSTFGRTPPCTDLIISRGIKRVFVGVLDPNPAHAGKGVSVLKENGIEVHCGIEKESCAALITDFTKIITTGLPFITMKIAQSIDGKIATSSGQSRWITCEESRNKVHEIRKYQDAVLVGIGTVLKDDPMLISNLPSAVKQPMRVVFDSSCKIPVDSKLVLSARENVAPLTIFTTSACDSSKADILRTFGVNIVMCKGDSVDPQEALYSLAKMNIMNVLVEGGGQIFGSFIKKDLVDDIHFFIAPIIIGGDSAKSSVGGSGFFNLSDSLKLENYHISRSGADMWVYSRIKDYSSKVIEMTDNFKG